MSEYIFLNIGRGHDFFLLPVAVMNVDNICLRSSFQFYIVRLASGHHEIISQFVEGGNMEN